MCYGVIYAIENKVNGKIYVGQTTKSFNERYGGDIEKNTHNKHLQNSIKKYGIENFTIDKCICECDTKESLDEAEKFYIDFFDSANPEHGYNKTLGGEGGTPNEETRKKISKAKKGKYCGEKNSMYGKNAYANKTKEEMKIIKEKISQKSKETWQNPEYREKQSESRRGKNNGMYNKHHTEKAKQKMSQAKKGKKLSPEAKQKISKSNWLRGKTGENHPSFGKHHTEEAKQRIGECVKEILKDPEIRKKISVANSGKNNGRARAIIQLDINFNFLRKFNYIGEVERELNIPYSSISRCCKDEKKSKNNYKFMYEEDYIDLIKYGF